MEEQLVSFETAKLAKEKGFNIPTYKLYTKDGMVDSISAYNDYEHLEDMGDKLIDYFDGLYNWNFLPKHNRLCMVTSFSEADESYIEVECSAPTQSLLQKFIREKRGVHIEIHRNASGYYWSMCMSDGGTDLGWSDVSGPNDGGTWNFFEDALENALQIQLSYDLPNDTKIINHWGNYVKFALKNTDH